MKFGGYLLTSAAVMLPFGASAQGAFELEEAVVFSGLLPVEVNRTGASVEVIDDTDLEGASQSVQEALTRLPGVSVVANGGLGQESTLAIRGLGETYVGVTFDGIEVTDPAAPTNAFAFGQLSRAAVGRLELSKGTQTAVYGSDAIAGTVDVTSWRPSKDGLSYGGSAEIGSFGNYAGTFHLGQRDAGGDVALTLSRIVSDGYAADNTNEEKDGFRQTLLTFSIDRSISETVSAGLSFFRSDDETEYDAFGAEEGLSDGERTGVRLFSTIDAGGIEHEIATSYFNVVRDEVSAFGPFPFEGTRRKLEYIGRTAVGGSVDLAFGADWTKEISAAGGVPYEDENGGVFGEVNWAPTDATDLSFSLRHDVYTDFDDQTTGRIAAVHRMGGDLTIKGTLGTGYRAPSLQERFGFGGNPAFVPEESVGGDLGVTKGFANGSVTATVFYTEIDSLIRYDRATFSLFQLPGTTVSQGVELSGDWKVGAASLYGAYTYTDATTEDARLVRVPRHDLTLGLEMPVTDKVRGGIELRHVMDLLDVDGAGTSVALDDYTVANVSVSYDLSEKTQAYLRVDNILDEDYQTTLGYDAPGRSVFVGLRASF